jgi:hypothetical protein
MSDFSKRCKVVVLVTVCCFASLVWPLPKARAGLEQQAKILGIGAMVGSGPVLIDVSLPITNRAACASVEFQQAFALSINTDRSRAILALLTSAMIAGKTVNIRGSGTCSAVSSWTGSGGLAENVAAVSVSGH